MAKRFSAQRALQLIWEEREAFDDGRGRGFRMWGSPFWLWLWRRGWNWASASYKTKTSPRTSPSKKGKNVVLMSTLYRDGRICGQEHQNQRSSWIMMLPKESWTTRASWWLPTATKGEPNTGQWWYSLTYWKILRITPYSSGWHWTQSGTEGSSREDAFSRGTGKGTGENSNQEKTTCSKNPSLCSHREEDSGGECRQPIHPTLRITINISLCSVNWPEWDFLTIIDNWFWMSVELLA